MPTIEHKDIIDPNIHEPKGAASASVNHVYVANGLGSGSWQPPPVFSEFGSMAVRANSTGTVLVAAADTTLYTASQYTPFTSFWSAGSVMSGVTFGAGVLTVATTGTYLLLANATLKSSVNNVVAGYKTTINGVAQVGTLKHKMAAAGDEYTVSGSSIISLTAGQTVGVALAVNTNTTLTITDAGVSLILIKE